MMFSSNRFDNDDKKPLYKPFESNKELLEAVKVDKKDFCLAVLDVVDEILDCCYEKAISEVTNNSCFHRSLPTRPIPAGHNAYDVLPVLFLIW